MTARVAVLPPPGHSANLRPMHSTAGVEKIRSARSGRRDAARALNRASGMLALSVLLDSGVEHYRGGYDNPAMFAPLVVSALTLAVSAHGLQDRGPDAHRGRQAVYAAAATTGVVGTGFHLYNILKRPGRLDWQNAFYGAPAGAPMAMALAGLLGVAAERARCSGPKRPRVGRWVAAVCAAGMLGSAAEAALLHFRGAFNQPAMYAPVTVPPIAGALLAGVALNPGRRDPVMTRFWLKLTAMLGLVGTMFHIRGVQRCMGGWRNWSQNLLSGPPLPAPPSFTALALAGLAALGLVQDNADE